jgi:hypothetical protein
MIIANRNYNPLYKIFYFIFLYIFTLHQSLPITTQIINHPKNSLPSRFIDPKQKRGNKFKCMHGRYTVALTLIIKV